MLEKYLCIGLPKRDAKPFIRHLMLLFLQHKFESPILNVALALNSFLFGVNTPLQFMSNSYFYPVLSVNRLMGLWVLLKDTLWRTLCSWMWYDAYCYLCVTHRYINYYQLLVMILDLKFLYSKLLLSLGSFHSELSDLQKHWTSLPYLLVLLHFSIFLDYGKLNQSVSWNPSYLCCCRIIYTLR